MSKRSGRQCSEQILIVLADIRADVPQFPYFTACVQDCRVITAPKGIANLGQYAGSVLLPTPSQLAEAWPQIGCVVWT